MGVGEMLLGIRVQFVCSTIRGCNVSKVNRGVTRILLLNKVKYMK